MADIDPPNDQAASAYAWSRRAMTRDVAHAEGRRRTAKEERGVVGRLQDVNDVMGFMWCAVGGALRLAEALAQGTIAGLDPESEEVIELVDPMSDPEFVQDTVGVTIHVGATLHPSMAPAKGVAKLSPAQFAFATAQIMKLIQVGAPEAWELCGFGDPAVHEAWTARVFGEADLAGDSDGRRVRVRAAVSLLVRPERQVYATSLDHSAREAARAQDCDLDADDVKSELWLQERGREGGGVGIGRDGFPRPLPLEVTEAAFTAAQKPKLTQTAEDLREEQQTKQREAHALGLPHESTDRPVKAKRKRRSRSVDTTDLVGEEGRTREVGEPEPSPVDLVELRERETTLARALATADLDDLDRENLRLIQAGVSSRRARAVELSVDEGTLRARERKLRENPALRKLAE